MERVKKKKIGKRESEKNKSTKGFLDERSFVGVPSSFPFPSPQNQSSFVASFCVLCFVFWFLGIGFIPLIQIRSRVNSVL